MQFSRNWLAEYVELPEAFETLAAALTGAGLAVEGTEQAGDDVLFEVEVTSNRADCMSHLGIAREVGAVLGVPVEWPEVPPPGAIRLDANSWGAIEIEDPEGCPRYVGVVVRGIEVGESPAWLKDRLASVGVRSINNVVDVTNFVLWESGQPLHAFDADKLRDRKIVVRSARVDEELVTLDGEVRELDPEILVIADGQGAVALAGIMGGRDSEVTETTANVLIESAHFAPSRVRNGAKKLAMHTDASHRFERGSDYEACLDAALRTAQLLRELCGGEIDTDAVDVRPRMAEPLCGRFTLDGLNAFAGTAIEESFVVEQLKRLGFELVRLGDDNAAWEAHVPSWRRFDFEADSAGKVYPAYFYEEVLRLRGFDAIPSTLPAIEGPDLGLSQSHHRREELRSFLAASGLAETITYSFGAAEADSRFESLVEGPALELANALSEQYALMRRSLLPNLVEGALFNLRRGSRAVRLFEFGHLFPASGDEVDAFAVVLGGTLGSPWQRSLELDFFDLRGVFEAAAQECGVELEFVPCELTGMLPGTSAEIRWRRSSEGDSRRVGYLGRVDEPESPVPLYAGEIEVEALERVAPDKFVPVSRHPGVAVDLTLTHSVETPWAAIAEAIEVARPELLSGFEMSDRYGGKGVPEGAVNTTIAFRYSASDRSLTQDEVNDQHGELVNDLESKFGLSG